jgi:hypothetical protein
MEDALGLNRGRFPERCSDPRRVLSTVPIQVVSGGPKTLQEMICAGTLRGADKGGIPQSLCACPGLGTNSYYSVHGLSVIEIDGARQSPHFPRWRQRKELIEGIYKTPRQPRKTRLFLWVDTYFGALTAKRSMLSVF